MIRFEEALKTVLEHAPAMGKMEVALPESLGRFLAQDVVSDMDMPPFDKSAMDGYACRRADLSKTLTVIETVAAGTLPAFRVETGQCTRIMTGARIPEGSDCVVKLEDTEEAGEGMIRFIAKDTRDNIAQKAEDVRKGDILIRKGTRIAPQHIAVMAMVGLYLPKVARMPKIDIFSTGDELVEPFVKPVRGQIRNSNGYQLLNQAIRAGADPAYMGILPDREKESLEKIRYSLDHSDVILLSGGVSQGDFDFLPAVFEKLRINILFRTIASQPGKPTIFGTYKKKVIFGLPGNPVSSFNLFELLVRPMLEKMMGREEFGALERLPMGVPYRRKKSDRLNWFPVVMRDGKIYPVEYHGSAHISAHLSASHIAAIPIGVTELNPGDLLDVRPI